MTTSIALGADHGGLELKNIIKNHISDTYPDLSIVDCGTFTEDSVNYPDFAAKVVEQIKSGKAETGILVCGTGIGISIKANRYNGIRAALIYNEFTAEMAKAHNNANIVCLGGRTTEPKTAKKLVDIWIKTEFEGGRHQNRLDLLDC